MRPIRRSRAGFTLIEALVVLAILSILLMLGMPEMLRVVRRSRLEGYAQTVAGTMRICRFEAVRQNVNTRLFVDYTNNQVLAATVDAAGDPVEVLGTQPLPSKVDFWAWNEDPRKDNAIVGFTTTATGGFVEFRPNGSADTTGGVRLSDGNNYLEVAVATQATGRIELRKAEPDPKTSAVGYRVNGEREYSWDWK
jgi:prepilin-type N-terminal cleavage/methylation domain-containing protein